MKARSAPPEHFEWLTSRTGLVPTSRFSAIEAVDELGAVRGMVGFDDWTPHSVSLHIACDSPLAWRALIPAAVDYAFRQEARGLVLGLVRSSNSKALQATRRIGFREAHRVRDGWAPGDDLVLLEMRRDECRWPTERQAA